MPHLWAAFAHRLERTLLGMTKRIKTKAELRDLTVLLTLLWVVGLVIVALFAGVLATLLYILGSIVSWLIGGATLAYTLAKGNSE